MGLEEASSQSLSDGSGEESLARNFAEAEKHNAAGPLRTPE
jgi:hypothetical protein